METLRTPDARFADLPDFPYEPKYVDVDDTEGGMLRVAYIDEGDPEAPAVLMLHGEPSWSYLYRKMIPVFVEAGYRAIAPDLPGFGRSDKPTKREDYTYARHVQWMTEAVEGIGLRDIRLVCQDWGGLIGLRLVAAHPEWFSAVVVANSFLPTGDAKMPDAFFQWRELSQRLEDMDVGMVLEMGTLTDLSTEVVDAYRAPFPDASYKAGAHVFPALVPASPEDPEAPANREAWKVLREFDKPFLTVFGTGDPIMAGSEKALQKFIPGTADQPHSYLEAGHFIQEDAGEELAARSVEFFQANKV